MQAVAARTVSFATTLAIVTCEASYLHAEEVVSAARPASPVAPPAPSEAQLLQEARVAMEDQRYDDALATVTPLLVTATPPSTRVKALEIAAVAHLLLGRDAEARPLVYELYELAPAFELVDRSLPPRVTAVFARELAQPHSRGAALTIRPLSSEVADYEIRVSRAAYQVDVVCRKDAGPLMHVDVINRPDGTRRFRLPTLGTYQCAAIAFDNHELPLGRLGSRTAPISLHALEKANPGLATKWWFWTGVGAVVIGGATAAFVIARSQDAQPRPRADIDIVPVAPAFRIP
jgi:hypothetical protein